MRSTRAFFFEDIGCSLPNFLVEGRDRVELVAAALNVA